MDPYLESPAIWPDFHATFLPCIRAELNKTLPSPYLARMDRYVWIEEPEQLRLLGKPDAYLADPSGGSNDPFAKTAVLSAPVTVTLPLIQPRGKSFLKIIDVHSHRVITVLELLSPANKTPGKDRDAYLAKREEYLASSTNLVELDLLRGGVRPPVRGPMPAADYYIIVCPASQFPRAGVWPMTVRDPFPEVPIPLLTQDPALGLSLQNCFQRAFAEGRYDQEIDYQKPSEPALTVEDESWFRELLAYKLDS